MSTFQDRSEQARGLVLSPAYQPKVEWARHADRRTIVKSRTKERVTAYKFDEHDQQRRRYRRYLAQKEARVRRGPGACLQELTSTSMGRAASPKDARSAGSIPRPTGKNAASRVGLQKLSVHARVLDVDDTDVRDHADECSGRRV
jgi:hypothetical protein